MGNTPAFTSIGGANAAGYVSTDYTGSRDEWEERVIRTLVDRYKNGLGGMGGSGDPSIGAPAAEDFGTPGKPISYQTWNYWENYVRKFGATDPWITQNFGTPPGRSASYVPDPNSEASIQGTWEQRNAAATAEGEKNRAVEREKIAAQERIAAMQEAGATQRVTMQVESDWKIASLQDATRRYIAEGDWGVQKWVTTENNSAAMERLKLELAQNDKELAQRAIEEKNRHHEQMVGLALEVAKYDAELAASPRNWLKYAGWLQARNIVVNGMTLAMAAQEVPENTIDPALVTAATGSNLAGIQTALESGQSGGAASSQNAFGGNMQEMFTGAEKGAGANVNLNAPQGATGQFQAPPSAQQLGAQTDYKQLANDLLGMNPLAATAGDASNQNLQNIANNLSTTGRPRIAGFGAYFGPTKNALGIEIPEVAGKDVDYRQFSNLLPSEQQMKVGAVESVRGAAGVTDWVEEMERSRPKGGAFGAAGYG